MYRPDAAEQTMIAHLLASGSSQSDDLNTRRPLHAARFRLSSIHRLHVTLT